MKTSTRTIADWKEYARFKLPAEDFVTKRNHRITAEYATLYNNFPHCLKWAGMASFASHKVGLALAPFQLYLDENGCLRSDTHNNTRLAEDLNIIRYTNNKIYDDIAWIHFAYTSDEGGIELIKYLLENEPEHKLLLDGFLNIDIGRKLLETNADKLLAEKYIWEGNSLLLKHEQMNTVQPMFKKFDFAFRRFLSISTAMDFDSRNLHLDLKTYTSFYLYMWVMGIGMLLRTRSLPAITNFEHRWLWINKRMLKIWKHVDMKDSRLKEKILKLIHIEPTYENVIDP